MGGETLASFFLKVQAVEESFLLLEAKERSRALNILQSAVNKLLNFVGDADVVSSTLSTAVPDTFLSAKGQKCKLHSSASQVSHTGSGSGNTLAQRLQKRKGAIRCKDRAKKMPVFVSKDQTLRKDSDVFTSCSKSQNTAHSCAKRTQSVHQPTTEESKHETKDNFDDDFQELADFDYDFDPNLQQTNANTVSRAGTGIMAQCGGKFAGKLLSMSRNSDRNICQTSEATSRYHEQVLEVSASCDSGSVEVSHSHYGGQLLASAASEMKATCHLGQPPYRTQILSCSQMDSAESSQYTGAVIDSGADLSHSRFAGGVIDSSRNPSQYAGGVIDSNGDPSQYAGGVIDSSGDPSQYARGVIDSSGDPSQYAGGVIDSSGDPAQYAGSVMDSSDDPSQFTGAVIDTSGDTTQYGGGVITSTSEGSQYAGGVIEMTDGQDPQMCDPSQVHTQYSGAMIPTAQDVTVCTTTQYPGTVLAMTVPESITYSCAQYSHAIMQGLNTGSAHAHFAGTVLDMSAAAAASRQGDLAITAAQTPISYPATIFEGAVLGSQAGSGCGPFQFRRPGFEPHEAFHRSQELTLMHASMLQQQQQLYQLHQQTVTSRWRVFICRECGVSLTHYRSIKAHLLTHGSGPLSCRSCRQVLVNNVALRHHLCGGRHWKQSAMISKEMNMCHECGKFFTSRIRLCRHWESEHHAEAPVDTKYTCRFCGLQLSKKTSVVRHYRQHAGGRFVCRRCGAILNDFVQYACHMSAHEKRLKKCTCQHCGKVCSSLRKLGVHVKAHEVHACNHCRKVYLSLSALAKHLVKAHPHREISEQARSGLTTGHQCDLCHKRFARRRDLEVHSRLHYAEKVLDCSSCKMRFQSKRALNKHQRSQGHCQHTGKVREAQHLCSECGKAYFRRQALHRHLRQHQSSKPFTCKYCNFRCGAKDNMRRHEAHHFSTERNFICELCGAAFHAKKTLEMHHNYKHNSERRFKCSECPMTFKARNALNRHAKTHSCSREHGCWCGAAFNRLYNLRRHMRLVHGSDDALPPLRKVEVLDSNRTVKQAASTPPAKKMLLKSRKVKADCMQEEQEAAAAAVVVVVGEEEAHEEEERTGEDEAGEEKAERGVSLSQTVAGPSAQQLGLGPSISGYSPAMAVTNAAAAGGGMMGPGGVIHPFSHPHPHLTMEQSYAMVSATLHHHHHHHHHNLHHHHTDPQQALLASATAGAMAETTSLTPHPFPHLPHPSLDYSQLPALSTVVPYSGNVPTSNAVTTTVADAGGQRQDYFPASGVGGTLEGNPQSTTATTTADYTTSPFSLIQNFLLPPVGVANLLDLTHSSGAK